MRRRHSVKVVTVWAACLLAAFVAHPAASAQDSDDAGPDYTTGWVLRSSEVSGEALSAGALAGSPEVGFVVIDNGGGVYSRDGHVWSRFSLGEGAGHVIDVAAGPRGFVAIAGPGGPAPPTVWHSHDGRSWAVVDPDSFPVPATPAINDGGLTGVVAGADGFIITGVQQCETFAWFSPNGRNWSVSSLPEECGTVLMQPADVGWKAWARVGAGAAVLESVDGRTWAEIGANDPPLGIMTNRSFAVRGDTLVVTGGAATADGTRAIPAVWVSRDAGTTWTETTFDETATESRSELAAFPITATDLGFVAVNYLETRAGLVPGSLVFSTDGSSWRQVAAPELFFELVASQDSVIATAIDGIYTWTPPGSELAATGGGPSTLLLVLGGLLVTAGLTMLEGRRLVMTTLRTEGSHSRSMRPARARGRAGIGSAKSRHGP